MDIQNLFTPEVMERMFSVLETAAQGSAVVLAIYLLIPILAAIVTAGSWVFIIYYITSKIHKGFVSWVNRPKTPVVVEKYDKIEVVKEEAITRKIFKVAYPTLSSTIDLILERDGNDYLREESARRLKKIVEQHYPRKER